MLLTLLHLLLSLIVTPVHAATTPTPTPEVMGTTTGGSLNEIQKLRQAVQEKVKEKLKEITSTTPVNSKRAYIGTISLLDPTEITLDFKNQQKKVTIAPETVYIDAKRNKTKYDSLKVGQDILAMGLINDKGGLDAKRIVLVDLKTIVIPTQITIGQVVDISKSSSIFVLIPSNHKDSQYQIKMDTKTEIVDKAGAKLLQKDLVTGSKVITILQSDPKTPKTFTAQKIVILTETKAQTTPSPTPSTKKTP